MNEQELVQYAIANHEKVFIAWHKKGGGSVLLKAAKEHETIEAIDLNSGSIPVVIIEKQCQVDVADEWNLKFLGEIEDRYTAGLFTFYQVKTDS